MTVYFDENMPPHLARGFHTIQQTENLRRGNRMIHVKLLKDDFGSGSKDLDWIAKLKGTNSFIITRDIHLDKRKDEVAAYHDSGLGLFFIRGASKKTNLSIWEMLNILSRQWEEMIKIMTKRKTPFSYVVKYAGKPKQLK